MNTTAAEHSQRVSAEAEAHRQAAEQLLRDLAQGLAALRLEEKRAEHDRLLEEWRRKTREAATASWGEEASPGGRVTVLDPDTWALRCGVPFRPGTLAWLESVIERARG